MLLTAIKQYRQCLQKMPVLFVSDFLFCYIVSNKRNMISKDLHGTKSLSLQFNATELRRLLILHSVEQLTLFHQVMSRDYRSVCTIVTTDIQAMHAYNCGHYQLCLELSQQNVGILLDLHYAFIVPIFGCMTHLMDDDLTSLSAVSLFASNRLKGLSVTQVTLSL